MARKPKPQPPAPNRPALPKRQPPYCQPAPNRPVLPPELWQRIFELASSLDELLDIDPGGIFPDSAQESKRRLCSMRKSSATRACIVRVCKYWHVLGMPVLYSHLHLQWTKKVISLLTRLTSNGCDASTHVKRIDLMGCIHPAIHSELHQNLLRLFPNVQILTIAAGALYYTGSYIGSPPGFRVHSRLLAVPGSGQRQMGRLSQSLRALVWYMGYNRAILPAKDLGDLLQNTPNLRVLRWHFYEPRYSIRTDTDTDQPAPTQTIHLPHLHALRFPRDPALDPRLLSQNYISLRKIICIPNRDDGWKAFIQRHGDSLRRIEIPALDVSPTAISHAFDLIQRYCPNVARVDVLTARWTIFPVPASLPSNVATLGIGTRNTNTSDDDVAYVLQALSNLSAPGLKVVQFLVKSELRALQNREVVWDEIKGSMAARRIAIQDWTGSRCN